MTDPIPTVTDLGLSSEVASDLLPLIDSFVKWELLRFLHNNPASEATMEELARYVGRDEYEVQPAVRALVNAGLMEQRDAGPAPSYRLTSSERLTGMLGELVSGFAGDRLIRLAVSTHILAAARRTPNLQYAVAT